MILALRRSGSRLAALYSKPALSDEDIVRAVAILDETRARDYVQPLAAQYEARARAALEAAAPRSPVASRLHDLIAALTGRQK